MNWNDDLERIWKEAGLAYLVLFKWNEANTRTNPQ
jgi:hypothetical protein